MVYVDFKFLTYENDFSLIFILLFHLYFSYNEQFGQMINSPRYLRWYKYCHFQVTKNFHFAKSFSTERKNVFESEFQLLVTDD